MSLEEIKRVITESIESKIQTDSTDSTDSTESTESTESTKLKLKSKNSLNNAIYNLLNNYEPDKIIYCLKLQYPEIEIDYLNNDETNDTNEIIDKQPINSVVRKDAKFREAVKARFKTCIICDANTCIQACCEVAHIWDFALCDSQSAYNPNNGILICANWHILFDKHLMKLEPIETTPGQVRIRLDNELINTALYDKYNGKTIMLLPENIPFLKKRIASYNKK